MIKETKRTSSSSRAITILMELVIQGTKTTVTHRDPHWKKWELFLLPLPQVDLLWPQTISVPTPMLPTPTPDQAHRSHRAAWDTQLPPSSRRSTRTRPTGTELHPVPSGRRRWCCRTGRAAACQEPALGHRMYCTTTPPTVPPPRPTPCHGAGGGSHLVPGVGVRLEKKVLARFVLWICYFCSLLDMVQTDRCIFFSDSL